jgi:hypothetical protein
MNGLVRLGENPFASLEKPRRHSPETKPQASLEEPWRSIEDLDAAVAALPPSVKRLVEAAPKPVRGESGDFGRWGDTEKMVEQTLKLDNPVLKGVFGSWLGLFLDSEIKLGDQLAERLRRQEDRGAIIQSLVAEMDRLYSGHRAPFVTSVELEARLQDAQGKLKELAEHMERHDADLRTLREKASPYLQKSGYLAPYERELVKKYRSLFQFLGSEENASFPAKGHRDDLRAERNAVTDLVKELSEQHRLTEYFESLMARASGRLAPEDLADIWLQASERIHPVNPLKIRYMRNIGYEVEAKAAEEQGQQIQSLMFDAVLAWLAKHESAPRPSKAIGVLTRRFGEVRSYLESAKRDRQSMETSLQHAQIILRRLVQLAE